jgi:hypothetical protein
VEISFTGPNYFNGSYSVIPTGPVSVSGGGGSGATFNLTHANTTIAKILDGGTSVRLSNPVRTSATGMYNFDKPVALPRSDDAPAFGTHQLTFDGSFTERFGQNPEKFAATIYDVMAAFSHLPPTGSKLSRSAQLLSFCIGCNIGDLGGNFGVPVEDRQNQIRDQLKSIMRGVSDFEKFNEFGNPDHPFTSQWYPDPKEERTGALIDGIQTQRYNVFNLNPYVFFVHKTLGMNGYGFSVDDDTADVGALGSHLQIAFGSTAATPPGQSQKLANLNYYTGGAPYGTLQGVGYVDNTNPYGASDRALGRTVIVLPTSLVARLVAADAQVTGALASDSKGILKSGTRVINIAAQVPQYGVGPDGESLGVVIVTTQGVPHPSTDGPRLDYTFSGFNTLLPVVSDFSPTSGTPGVTTVNITGHNFGFTSGVDFHPVVLSVTFNGIPVEFADIQVHSESALTVKVPAGATSGKIAVRSAAGTGYSSTDFFIGSVVAPTLTSTTPASGSIKDKVKLTGTGFTGVTNVKFNGVSALSFRFVSDTTIEDVVVPDFGIPVGNIVVFTAGGDTSASPPVTYTINPPAAVSFTPASGPVGTPVTLSGTGFTGATSVKFNLTPVTSITVVDDKTIRVIVPDGAASGPISVTTSGGTGASAGSFTVTPSVAPSNITFSPQSGPVGTPVTLTGNNFTGSTSVTFNGIAVPMSDVTVVSDTTITTKVPALATTGPVAITNAGGTGTSAMDFTVTPTVLPIIESFSPANGPVNTPVKIFGSGFTGVTEVHFFDGIEATFTFISDTEIHTHVPNSATTGPISVHNSAGTGVSTTSFHVTDDEVVTLLSSNVIGEKLPVGTLVGTLSSTPAGTYTYQLVSGGDNASFTIAGNHLLSAAIFDFNVKSQYHITVKTFQGATEVASTPLAIDVQRASVIVAGDSDGSSTVVVYNAATRDEIARFNAFPPDFKGGVRVAVGDVNGDGVADIVVGVGNGRAPTVKVVDGTKLNLVDANGMISKSALLFGFNAFADTYTGGIHVAAADLNQDGRADIVTGRATGQSRVRVFDGQTGNQSANFLAFNPNFDGGVRVAAVGQVGGHHAQVIVGQGSGGGRVKVVDATLMGSVQGNGVINDSALLASFLPYANNTQGVFVSAGDVNGDGFADIVTGRAGSPTVRVFDGASLHTAPFTDPTKLFDFLAFSPGFKGGVRVGMAQINGRAQILAAPGNPGGVPVKIADSSKLGTPGWLQPDNQIADAALLDSFFVFNNDGVFVGG